MLVQVPRVEGDGWGGRIRTYVWRIQSPLPYHLATPQWLRFAPSIGSVRFFQTKFTRFLRSPRLYR